MKLKSFAEKLLGGPASYAAEPAAVWRNIIVGDSYECRKNSKKARRNIIAKMHVGDSVSVEFFRYKGRPAYLVVDDKSGLDIGVFSQVVADKIYASFPNAFISGHIDEIDGGNIHIVYSIFPKE